MWEIAIGPGNREIMCRFVQLGHFHLLKIHTHGTEAKGRGIDVTPPGSIPEIHFHEQRDNRGA